eukprot:CAMPEP_0180102440 /NCGR_PEP_ID=MMETSP0985-20121206/30163_1 /TAXON_ID=483367 /ORGANISM="non described non described, Strain CCMP 2436" /LENGTH=175 /DNA_ID=CAMNT_0022038703 /DNA_START=509 /DNA_END=1033 /DNA_ORIENTATION=+
MHMHAKAANARVRRKSLLCVSSLSWLMWPLKVLHVSVAHVRSPPSSSMRMARSGSPARESIDSFDASPLLGARLPLPWSSTLGTSGVEDRTAAACLDSHHSPVDVDIEADGWVVGWRAGSATNGWAAMPAAQPSSQPSIQSADLSAAACSVMAACWAAADWTTGSSAVAAGSAPA